MKKELCLVLAVVAILLIVTGCTKTATTREQGAEDTRIGTQGLVISFEPNLPPTKMYDDQPLEVVVKLENRGTYEVGGVGDKLYISGFDSSIFTGVSTFGEQIPQLEGASYGFAPQDAVSFTSTIRDLGSLNINKYATRIQATACYGYKTVASANVCIDPDPYSIAARTKACTPQNVGLGSGQGAPISVSNIQLDPSKGRTRFQITISNAGGGDVFKPGAAYLSKCSPYSAEGLRYNEFNYIHLDDVSVLGRSILSSCQPGPDILITNSRATIYCELSNIAAGSPVTTPLTVVLSYGYTSTIFRDVTVLAVNV
jgi:hypothetical protein